MIKITYFTLTGHSRKIAKRLANDLKIESMKLGLKTSFENVNTLIIVSAVYGGQTYPKVFEILKTLDLSQLSKVLILTHSVSMKDNQTSLVDYFLERKIEVFEHAFTSKFLWMKRQHPTQEEYDKIIEFIDAKKSS